ncbi:hypothetical protein Ssi03_11930 [Sphaerisporangium siamense]|nr:hypothetical protein Ssi03_11930 [Sphaerisporangium siamense]
MAVPGASVLYVDHGDRGPVASPRAWSRWGGVRRSPGGRGLVEVGEEWAWRVCGGNGVWFWNVPSKLGQCTNPLRRVLGMRSTTVCFWRSSRPSRAEIWTR